MITATHKGKMYDVEYSLVNVLEFEKDLRFGGETYHSEKLNSLLVLNKKADNVKVGTCFQLVRNLFDPKNSPPKEVRLLELENMGNFEIYDIPKVSSTEFESTKNIARYGDVVISKLRPYLKQIGFIYLPEVYTSTELLILRQKHDRNRNLNYYLYVFLMSKWVQKILFWSQEGTNHPRFPQNVILDCPMPLPSQKFIDVIEDLIKESFKKKEESEKFFKQAESLLSEELELENWKPRAKKIIIGGKKFETEDNIAIINLSEAIKTSRFDAEYWEPKYIEFEEVIRSYKKSYDYLPNLIEISKEKINIDLNDIYNYIELADINPNLGVVNQTSQIIGKELPSRARMKVERDYIIMSSVEGSIDKIALIDFDKENLVASTGFFVFKEKVLNKETILVLLKLLAEKYLRREAQGTILTAIPYNSLKRIILPKVDENIQIQISQLIQQSLKARENSKKLLEVAKKAVEIAIEKNEKEALEYMKQETNYSGITVVNKEEGGANNASKDT